MAKKATSAKDPSTLKAQNLDALLAGITKDFGKGAVMRMGSDFVPEKVETWPFDIKELDIISGGGVPKGRVVEIYGPEASGKTTLMLHLVAAVQRRGGTVAFVDVEHAIDLAYADDLGVNVGELLLCQPDSGEEALNLVERFAASGAVDLVVCDSVAQLVPRAELEGDVGDSHMGLVARMMGQALRKITPAANKNNCTVCFINQLRMKIGVMFGNPETTPGGKALPYAASQRYDIRRNLSDKILDGQKEMIGNATKIKIIKNKIAPPFKDMKIDIEFGKGYCLTGNLLDMAERFKLVSKSGAWYKYDGDNVAQGRANAKLWLEQNPEIRDHLDKTIDQIVFGGGELPDDTETEEIIEE